MDWALPNWLSNSSEAGSAERFEQVYRETAGFVRSAVYLQGGEADLDDIVQETFVRVWKALPRFEGRSSIRTWVYRIAINTARQHWRAKGRRREWATDTPPEQSVQAADVETAELIRRSLARLPEDQREAFVLHYYEGLSLREIAQVVSCSEGTVKSRLHYGRKALQELLKDGGITW